MIGSIAKDALRSNVIYLIVVAIVLPLGCVCVLIPTTIALNVNMSTTNTLLLVGVPALLFFVIVFGGTGVVAWVILARRKRWLDEVFAPLGLTGSPYTFGGRQYHGQIEDRQVDVFFTRGPSLDIRLSTSLHTRFGVSEASGDTTLLARMLGHEPLALGDPALEGLAVYALDEAWTRALLAHPQAQPALRRLLNAAESWAAMRIVRLDPERLQFRLYRSKNLFRYGFTPEEARQWLDDLLTLAHSAEALPAPEVTAEVTPGEAFTRSPQNVRRLAVVITLIILLGLLGCSAIAVVLGIWLGSS